jgi:hypothetical protein
MIRGGDIRAAFVQAEPRRAVFFVPGRHGSKEFSRRGKFPFFVQDQSLFPGFRRAGSAPQARKFVEPERSTDPRHPDPVKAPADKFTAYLVFGVLAYQDVPRIVLLVHPLKPGGKGRSKRRPGRGRLWTMQRPAQNKVRRIRQRLFAFR